MRCPATSVRRDDTGEDVKTIQKRLKELGYYRGLTDGKFGAQSVLALKAFQKANGLEADGVAGKGTYELLFSNQALKKGTTPTPLPEITPVPGDEESGIPSEASYETLRRGTLSADVAMMQQKLIDLGYLTGEPDGNYGTATEKAVRAFQKTNGLGVDGTAGSETLSRMYSIEAASASAASPPRPHRRKGSRPPAAAEDDSLKKGASGRRGQGHAAAPDPSGLSDGQGGRSVSARKPTRRWWPSRRRTSCPRTGLRGQKP